MNLATRETMAGRRGKLPSSCHFASTIGRAVCPAASERERKNWFDSWEEEEEELWREGADSERLLFVFFGGGNRQIFVAAAEPQLSGKDNPAPRRESRPTRLTNCVFPASDF